MATPMLGVMRKMNPERNIAVFAPWAAQVLTDNPAVDEIADNPLDAQRTVRLDLSVYGWASAHGWKGHLAEAYCRMFNLPAPEDLTPCLHLDDEPPPDGLPEGEFVVIAHWSTAKTFDFFGPSGNKNWMADRWAELMARIHYHCADVVASLRPASTPAPTVVQIRGSEEEPAIDCVDAIWTGRPLREVFFLIKDAALVISVDTFAHHAAAALGVPSVVLWGRSKPEHFGYRKPFIVNVRGECPGMPVQRPLMLEGHSQPRIVTVVQERPCINGDQWAMDQEVCPIEGHPCMAEILVDQVWEAVEEILRKTTAEGEVNAAIRAVDDPPGIAAHGGDEL